MNKYFEGDGIAFGEPGHYYKWIVPFRKNRNDFSFQEVSPGEYMDHEAFVLSLRLEQNLKRFPLPICFDPVEELREFSRRSQHIKEVARRIIRLRMLRDEAGRNINQ